jgi:serine/threonine-protein kinase
MERLIRDIRRSRGYAEEDISHQHFEPKTIYIAEGPFWMGSSPGEGIPQHETPQHEVILPAYRIGKYPVTNGQYEEFISQTKTLVSPIMRWDGQKAPEGLEDHPVTGVTWFEALAYCQWLSEKTGHTYSLPNEAQWEKACRGGNNNCLYPWGEQFDPARCNHAQQNIAPVNKYPAQNEFGCCDLVGNVLQWTCTLWGKKRFPPEPQYGYPWKDDGRNDLSANREIRRAVRGSTMAQDIASHRCSVRSGQAPEDRGFQGARYSFRIVMSV